MSTLLWLLTEAGLVLCWLVTPWAPAPWLALCWLMAPLAGWLALLLTRKRSQVRLTCPVTAEKGKAASALAHAQLNKHQEAEAIRQRQTAERLATEEAARARAGVEAIRGRRRRQPSGL